MKTSEANASCRHPWIDCDSVIPLAGSNKPENLPSFPEVGIPQKNPDAYFFYRLDLMFEAESALRSFLGLLVDFRQKRKLTQFLLGCCDLLEVSYVRTNGKLLEFRFQIDFSDRISIAYSTRMCGCIIYLDGKQDSFHTISPEAIDDLRQTLGQIWEDIRPLPIWTLITEKEDVVRLCHTLSAISAQFP